MSSSPARPSVLTGIALVVTAMACFASLDTIAKLISTSLPLLMAIWFRYSFQAVVTTLVVVPRFGVAVLKTQHPRFQMLRGLLLLTSSFFAFGSLKYLPVAEFTAIGTLVPLVITLLAARMLGRVRASGDFLETFSRQYRIFGSHRARRLLAPDLSAALGAAPPDRMRAAAADELPEADVIARVSALCLRGYTQNQLLRDIDAVSMAHSLEIRVPFLDPAVVDFALSLPDRSKLKSSAAGDAAYRESGAKRILLDATRDLLPPGIENQQKRGFGMPFGAWLRGPLRDILDDPTATHIVKARGLFNPAMVEQTRREFLQGRGSWALPWTLMMVELWCRGVLNAPARAAPTP